MFHENGSADAFKRRTKRTEETEINFSSRGNRNIRKYWRRDPCRMCCFRCNDNKD